MPFIRRIHLEQPADRAEHISHVQHSGTRGGPLELATRSDIVGLIERGTVFFSYNDSSRLEALVVVRDGANGRKHLSTIADLRETNNLLALPRF